MDTCVFHEYRNAQEVFDILNPPLQAPTAPLPMIIYLRSDLHLPISADPIKSAKPQILGKKNLQIKNDQQYVVYVILCQRSSLVLQDERSRLTSKPHSAWCQEISNSAIVRLACSQS